MQEEIVAEIESYQRIIDGARQVVESYKPTIKIDGDWPIEKVGDTCILATGATPSTLDNDNYAGGTVKWLVSGDVHQKVITDCAGRITEKGVTSARLKIHPIDSVMIALNGQGKTRGTVAILKTEATCNQSLVSINSIDKSRLSQEFIYYYLEGKYQSLRDLTGDNQRSGLNMPLIRNVRIPIPPIEEQNRIVAKLNFETSIVEQNKRLIEIFQQKINDKIAEVWGE